RLQRGAASRASPALERVCRQSRDAGTRRATGPANRPYRLRTVSTTPRRRCKTRPVAASTRSPTRHPSPGASALTPRLPQVRHRVTTGHRCTAKPYHRPAQGAHAAPPEKPCVLAGVVEKEASALEQLARRRQLLKPRRSPPRRRGRPLSPASDAGTRTASAR